MADPIPVCAANDKDISQNGPYALLILPIAACALMRTGNYSAALFFYRHGGGGINLYKGRVSGQRKRIFALDYHSFWDGKGHVKKLHYHRGDTSSQIRKHRPYQGW